MGHLARVKAETEGTLLSTGGGALELVYRSQSIRIAMRI